MHNTLYLNTSLCYFCNLEDETVTHMFVHCSETKRLWCAILESTLTLIWMGSLRVRFGVRAGLGWGGGGEVKLLLVYNPLELCKKAWHLVHKYTHACSFRKHYFQFQEPLHFADVSRFFCCKSSNFTQSNSMRAVLEIFWSCFQFL